MLKQRKDLHRWFMKLSSGSALVTILIGILANWAWWSGNKILAAWISDGPAMKYNSSLIFIAAGSALWLLRIKSESRLRKYAGRALCCFIALMGILSLVQHHFHLNLGIDNLFFSRGDRFPEAVPVSWATFQGRFSPIGGWLSLLMAGSLLLLDSKRRIGEHLGQIFSFLVGVVGTISFLAYLFGVKEFYNLSLYTRLALPATVALIVFSLGSFFARPDEGLASVIVSSYSGGILARRMVPSVSISVVVIGWFSWQGIQAGFYNEPYGFAMFLSASLYMILYFVWRNAMTLNLIDKKRTEAESSMQQSKDRLSLVMDAASMGYWDWDLATGRVEISQTLSVIYDFDPHETNFEFTQIFGRLLPEDRARVEIQLKRSQEQRLDFMTEFRIRCRNGSIRWLYGKGRYFYDSAGKAIRMLGINIDITDRKKIEERLTEALQQANEANKLKSAFLANMSHEIRTPLGVVLGFSELLNDSNLSNEERIHYFETIKRNGLQLSTLINDILDLSKVESGYINVEVLPTPVSETIQEVISALQLKAQEKNLSLQIDIDPSVPEVVGTDPTRLKQILTNVIGNAVKFTEKGFVKLNIEAKSSDLIVFRVSDSGIGISKEQSEKLFQPFSQADDSMTRKFGGTGLGLVLSKKLAQSLGGELVVKSSEPGVGSTFEFTIKNYAVPDRGSSRMRVEVGALGSWV